MISQRLRQLRRSRGFTLDQLSEMSGVNRGTIHRIELDQVSPRLDTLELLCRALGTDLQGFFGPAAPVPEAAPAPGFRDFRQGVLDWLGHLEALFHHSADGFAVTDAAGIISFESQVALGLRGDTPQGRLDRPWFHTAHPDDQPALRAGMASVLANPDEPVTLEYRVPAGTGTPRWVRATLRNQMAHPAIHGLVLTLHDITDWKAAEAQRRRLERLESQLQVVQAMTAEFSNLWMGFQGHLDVARLEGAEARRLSGLQASLDRASRMLHQMRDICGHPALDLKPLDLNRVVREQTGARRDLLLDLDPALPPVSGDGELLARMVGHLLDHLEAFEGDRTGPLRLTTSRVEIPAAEVGARFQDPEAQAGGAFVQLEIRCVCGCSQAPDGESLDPLFSTGLSDRRLALSAATRTARDHGGLVEHLTGPVVGGCVLRVLLPVAPAGGPAAGRPAAGPGPGLVLVVDDEDFVLSAMCQMLEAMGHPALGARNGQEALDLHTQHGDAVRLVLLDLNMPLVDGEAAYHELRRRDPKLPVVLCTGATSLVPEYEQRYEGIVGILRKPFRFEDLRRVIQSCLA